MHLILASNCSPPNKTFYAQCRQQNLLRSQAFLFLLDSKQVSCYKRYIAEGSPVPVQAVEKPLNAPVAGAEAPTHNSTDVTLSSLLQSNWEDIPWEKFKFVEHDSNGQMRERTIPKEVAQKYLLLLGLDQAFLTEEQIRAASTTPLTEEEEERSYKAILRDGDVIAEQGEILQ